MEGWQRIYINGNMDKLVEITVIREQLLRSLQAEHVLAEADLQQIRCRKDRFEKAGLFYDIVQTRRNGYVALAKALALCKQTGSLDILMTGLEKHVLPEIKVDISGNVKPLSEIFRGEVLSDLIERVKAQVTPLEYVNLYDNRKLSDDGIIKLLSDINLPKAPFYIPRSLSKPIKIKPTLFQVECPDIFVFKGMDRIQLADLVKPRRVTGSGTQIDEISCRFVFLEVERDWQDISDISKAPSHLIKYNAESQEFTLACTTGGSEVIHEYLCHTTHDQNTSIMSEDEFIQEFFRSRKTRGVCICDSPGMGKTLLLASLAKKVANQYPDYTVAFIDSCQFIEQVEKSKDNPIMPDANEAVLKYLSKTPLAYAVLNKLVEKNIVKFVLFFDGYDEIPFDNVPVANRLLYGIVANMPNTRICVTSRRHVRHQLEASLKVISYDILPFSQNNKIDFLVNFWKSKNAHSDSLKLSEFASFCVSKVQDSLKEEECDITGVPLQCRLLAQVYEKKATRYSQMEEGIIPEECCIFENSLPEMYTNYMELAFAKVCTNSNDTNDDVLEIKKYHIYIALKVIFPHGIDPIFSHLNATAQSELSSTMFSTGLLENRLTSLEGDIEQQFVHRSFAEYLASEYFVNAVSGQQPQNQSRFSTRKILSFVFKNIFKTRKTLRRRPLDHFDFVYPVVYFFNYFLKKISHQSPRQTLIRSFSSSVNSCQLYEILLTCLRHNYIHTFIFVKNILSQVGRFRLWRHRVNLFAREDNTRANRLISVAAAYSSVPLLEELFHLLSDCFQFQPSVLNQLVYNDHELLGTIIKRADYETVYYFIDNLNICHLTRALTNSYGDSSQTVEKKIEICKLIVGKAKNKSLVKEDTYPFSYHHLELLKFLIREGKDLHTVDADGKTVASSAAKYMKAFTLHEFYHFLINECKASYLFEKNEEKNWISPLHFILLNRRDIYVDTVKMVLECSDVNVNQRDAFGDTFLLSAAFGKQNLQMLVAIIEKNVHLTGCSRNVASHPVWKQLRGCNFYYRRFYSIEDKHAGVEENTFLHIASTYLGQEDYQQLIFYLSDTDKCSDLFRMKNKRQQLAIHLAVENIAVDKNTLLIFQECGVDLNSTDEKGLSLLMYAVQGKRDVKFLKLLIEMGVDVKAQNSTGNTFAHWIAAKYKPQEYHDIVEFLANSGELEAIFKITNNIGATPLHFAVCYLENLLPETVQVIGHLVNVNVLDIFGRSILDFASTEEKRSDLIVILQSYGVVGELTEVDDTVSPTISTEIIEQVVEFAQLQCDINEVDSNGNNVLQRLISHPSKNILSAVQFLITKGVNQTHINDENMSAYKIAIKAGIKNKEVLELLQ